MLMIEAQALAVVLTAVIGPASVVSTSVDWRDLSRGIDVRGHWPDDGLPVEVTLGVLGVLVPMLSVLVMAQAVGVMTWP